MGSLSRWMTRVAWLVLTVALVACAAFVVRWHTTRELNAMIDARTINRLAPMPADPRVRYAAAWTFERELKYEDAERLYTDVQATRDPALAARAWFALGNAFFESTIEASRALRDAAQTGETAELGLARDAYRAALRIDPTLHGARYNLELLERMAPPRPTDGWRRTTDPIKLLPDRHQGWTTIRETKKRGLP
jgi:hypothetical protein